MLVASMATGFSMSVGARDSCQRLQLLHAARFEASWSNVPSTSSRVFVSNRWLKADSSYECVRCAEAYRRSPKDYRLYRRPCLSLHSGDKGRASQRNRPSQQKNSPLDNNCNSLKSMDDGSKSLASSAQSSTSSPLLVQKLLTSTSYEGQQIIDESLMVVCKARHKGRVGIYKREGNVSLASFGIKYKKDKQGKKVDLTRSLSQMLPYVVAATAVSALVQPASFAWVSKDYYAPALGGIMLSIGVQLSLADFALVLKRPLPVLVGYIAQYMIKPFIGLLVVSAFHVPASFAAGLILTSCVAGAQLSSYAAFLSEGDVALSIILTSLTTVSSVIVTPLLTQLLIGSVVPVDVVAMSSSILQVVIFPVLLGLTLNSYAKSYVDKVRQFMPLMAMVCTSLCIGSPLAVNRNRIVSVQGLQLLFPVLAFHLGAFVLGYWISRLPFWRQDEKVSKTISLCTGMQSSTLAMLLATQFLGGSQAVPPACSVVVMAIMGLSLASYWGKGHRVRDVANHMLQAVDVSYA